jgi:hypothetical protein
MVLAVWWRVALRARAEQRPRRIATPPQIATYAAAAAAAAVAACGGADALLLLLRRAVSGSGSNAVAAR